MDIFRAAEWLMAMDEDAWARHANPWSVYSRFSGLPLLALAIWSRVWLGWWALVPLALVVLWIWLNPRLWPAPKRLDSWAAKGVMGERMFLARKTTGLPEHHKRLPIVLTWLSALGVLVLGYGLWVLEFWAVVAGMAVTVLAKTWFVDRMVWLWEESQGR